MQPRQLPAAHRNQVPPHHQPPAMMPLPQRVPIAAAAGAPAGHVVNPNPFNMGPLGVPAALDQAGRDRYSYNM